LMRMIKKALNEELGLDEISSMGGGSVEGFSGGKNKKSLIREEELMTDEESLEAYRNYTGYNKPDFESAMKFAGNFASGVADATAVNKIARTGMAVKDATAATEGEGFDYREFIPFFDKEDAQKVQGFGDKIGTPKNAAYLLRSLASETYKENPEDGRVKDIGSDWVKAVLQHEPGQVALKTAYEKGIITPDLFVSIRDGTWQPHLDKYGRGSYGYGNYNPGDMKLFGKEGYKKGESYDFLDKLKASDPKKVASLQEGNIKNHEEPIIEEVLNYLLSKMEIL